MKYLYQTTSGHVFIYTEELAKRKDMKEMSEDDFKKFKQGKLDTKKLPQPEVKKEEGFEEVNDFTEKEILRKIEEEEKPKKKYFYHMKYEEIIDEVKRRFGVDISDIKNRNEAVKKALELEKHESKSNS